MSGFIVVSLPIIIIHVEMHYRSESKYTSSTFSVCAALPFYGIPSLPCVNIIFFTIREPIRRDSSRQRLFVECAFASDENAKVSLGNSPSLKLGIPDRQVVARQREADGLDRPRLQGDTFETTKDPWLQEG